MEEEAWACPASLTDEADDAADERVEVTAVARHDGLLLSQERLPGGLHHVHGHLSDEDLGGERQKKRGRSF